MKIRIAVLLAFALRAALAAAAGTPDAAAYLLTLDGRVIDARHAERALPPASLTKLMTAWVLLQSPARLDETITVPRAAARMGGARAGLGAGERYAAADLFTAMLVASANDACLALAIHSAGSEAAFVARMNVAAAALGLRESRFANPCGFDAAGHYSSARDLLRLSEALWAQPRLREAVGRREFTLRTAPGSPHAATHALKTRNHLLGRLDGAVGVKTGHTRRAGNCIVARVERGGRIAQLVLLGAPERWWLAHSLLDHAFADAGSR